MKNRKRETCTSGSVRDEDGNILIYSASKGGGSSPLSMGQLGKIRDEPEDSAEGGSLRAMARAG
jgi:hypothetical protein